MDLRVGRVEPPKTNDLHSQTSQSMTAYASCLHLGFHFGSVDLHRLMKTLSPLFAEIFGSCRHFGRCSSYGKFRSLPAQDGIHLRKL
jgi:hypothetical protein